MPVTVNWTKLAGAVLNVKDVCLSIGKQGPVLALRLGPDQLGHVSQVGLNHVLASQLRNELVVRGRFSQLVDIKRYGWNVMLDLAVSVEEALFERGTEQYFDTVRLIALCEELRCPENCFGRAVYDADLVQLPV